MKFVKFLPYLLVLAGIGILVLQKMPKGQNIKLSGTTLTDPKDLKPVDLRNEKGPVSLEQFRGRWVILAFGYTSCPDVCPTTLAYLGKEYAGLLELRDKADVLFVSVDPERDRENMTKYVTHFHPEFTAATGTIDELNKFSKQLGVYFTHDEVDSEIKYTVAHSPNLFLLDPEGRWHTVFTPPFAQGDIEKDLRRLILRDSV